VDVDRPVECLEGLTLHEVHERLARHDAAGPLGERNEQLELIVRQPSRDAIDTRLAPAAIDFEPAERQHITLLCVSSSSQDRPQAR